MKKPSKWHVRPAKTQIRLSGCPGWSESSLVAQSICWCVSWGGSWKLQTKSHNSYTIDWLNMHIWRISNCTTLRSIFSWDGSSGTCNICWYQAHLLWNAGPGSSVECASDWYSGGHGFDPRVRQHFIVEISHEILSMTILHLPRIQVGQLSVTGKGMCTTG